MDNRKRIRRIVGTRYIASVLIWRTADMLATSGVIYLGFPSECHLCKQHSTDSLGWVRRFVMYVTSEEAECQYRVCPGSKHNRNSF